MLSISRNVHLSVRLSVCLSMCVFTFEVPFTGLFAPTSRSRMSNIFRDSESLGKGNGKKWSQIWTFLFENCLKSSRKKKFFFCADFADFDTVVELVGGGSVINGATPSSLSLIKQYFKERRKNSRPLQSFKNTRTQGRMPAQYCLESVQNFNFWTRNFQLSQLINYKGVCKTGPAKRGLLKALVSTSMCVSPNKVYSRSYEGNIKLLSVSLVRI